jgi:hypothetical protein
MNTQIAFCSACDRDVRVLMPDEPLHDAQAPVADAEVVCLEIGDRCTGSLCPVGAVSPTAMMVRLVRSGVRSVLQPIVKAECEACGGVTDYVIVSAEYATCAYCGTTVGRENLSLALGRDG